MKCDMCDGKGAVDLTEQECLAYGILYEPSVHDGHEDCMKCGGTGRVRTNR